MMNPLQRWGALLAGRPVDRPPFVPAVYEHKAALVGVTPSLLARNAELLERALSRELDLYESDALTVGCDVYNVEAEAVGARVRFYETNDVPSIETRPLRPGQDVRSLPLPDPERCGRMPVFLEAGRRIQARHGADVLVRGALSAPFSMACELVGDEVLLTALLDDPEWAASLLDFCSIAVEAYGKAFVDRGLGVILFDSHAAPPLVSPALYRSLILPPTARTIAYFRRDLEVPLVPYIVGGNTAPLLGPLLETGTNSVLCDFNSDLTAFVERLKDEPVCLRANLDPRFLEAAGPADITAAARRVLAVGAGHPRFVLGTGILPYDLPPEKVLAVRRALAGPRPPVV
jgi:uroporphyrinogen decarboxylase